MKTVRPIIFALALAAAGALASPGWAMAPGGARGRGPSPRPIAPIGWSYIWITPTYRTVTTQTWIPDATQLVPDWVETSPGHLEQVWRQIIIPGHYESTSHQVLVSDGYWELVRVDPPPVYLHPPMIVPSPVVVGSGTVGVEGYSSGSGEDLSKFSSLSEWPK